MSSGASRFALPEVWSGGVVASIRDGDGQVTGPHGISVESFMNTAVNDQLDALIDSIRDVVEELKLTRHLLEKGFKLTVITEK